MLVKSPQNHLLSFCKDNGFKNTNKTTGTRLNPITLVWTLLDVILCQSLKSFVDLTVFPISRSDHALVVGMFKFKKAHLKKDQIESRCLNPKKIEQIKVKFSKILPTFKFEYPDP